MGDQSKPWSKKLGKLQRRKKRQKKELIIDINTANPRILLNTVYWADDCHTLLFCGVMEFQK